MKEKQFSFKSYLSEIESTCTNIGIIKEGHCIFSGKTEELKNQMRSSRRLVIKTNEAESAFEKLKQIIIPS